MPTTDRAATRRTAASRSKSGPAVSTLVRALACVDLGDQFARDGDRGRALTYYGRALNDYLSEGLFTMASTVAERMIQRYPDVVRARMTLGVINLAEALRVHAAGSLRSTCAALEEYVRAAQSAGQQEIAVRQLRRLAEVTESEGVRERVAAFLRALGDEDGAEQAVHLAPPPAGRRLGKRLSGDQRSRWVAVLLSPPDAA